MELHYISRSDYRIKSSNDEYLKQFGSFYLIPEGGSNLLAIKGIKEFALMLNIDCDYLCCPVGTGGTLSGLIEGTSSDKKLIGFSVLKGGEFLTEDVRRLSEKSKITANWKLISDYHFGGYAKSSYQLEMFIADFKKEHGIPLDKIYTGKMMAGIYDLIKKGFFERGSTILAIHTGGMLSSTYKS
jgi:1-aminocyclopropane-1-carboxylate deaminase